MSSKGRKTNYIPLQEFLEKNKICDYGMKCNNTACKHIHKPLKTRMCKYAKNCKNGKNCSFAHSEKELFVPLCRFNKCKNKNCTYRHPTDWNVEETPPENTNKIENLTKKNFPNSMKIKNSKATNITINYKEMKNIIEKVDTITIANKDLEEMIDDYECVRDYEQVVFSFV